MSDHKSDRDLLIEIHTDSKWTREQLKTIDSRVTEVEKRQWKHSGVIGAALIMLELGKDKVLKFFQ